MDVDPEEENAWLQSLDPLTAQAMLCSLAQQDASHKVAAYLDAIANDQDDSFDIAVRADILYSYILFGSYLLKLVQKAGGETIANESMNTPLSSAMRAIQEKKKGFIKHFNIRFGHHPAYRDVVSQVLRAN